MAHALLLDQKYLKYSAILEEFTGISIYNIGSVIQVKAIKKHEESAF